MFGRKKQVKSKGWPTDTDKDIKTEGIPYGQDPNLLCPFISPNELGQTKWNL